MFKNDVVVWYFLFNLTVSSVETSQRLDTDWVYFTTNLIGKETKVKNTVLGTHVTRRSAVRSVGINISDNNEPLF